MQEWNPNKVGKEKEIYIILITRVKKLFSNSFEILNIAESQRQKFIASSQLVYRRKDAQFFTPLEVSKFMASLFLPLKKDKIRILDPGAGTGILTAALIEAVINGDKGIKYIEVFVVEIDENLNSYLKETLNACKLFCDQKNVSLSFEIIHKDFLELGFEEAMDKNQNDLFSSKKSSLGLFDIIILNPPYKKIRNSSATRKILNHLGEGSTNAYTAFLSMSRYLIEDGGQIIGITPRSFCNGGYYKRFRLSFFENLFFHKIHTYTRRDKAFNEDNVLQENILFVVSPRKPKDNLVLVTSSDSPSDKAEQTINISHDLIILPSDKDKIIHIINDEYSINILKKISVLPKRLEDIGIGVSTGKVVDFRSAEQLTENTAANSTALFYPTHLSSGTVIWPKYSSKKKEAIKINEKTKNLLIKSGYYTLCKRFSSKEEKKRIVAAFFDPDRFDFDLIGIENHLNYFHVNNSPLKKEVALGLTIYLNSTLVDQYFRLFNGHTQVNAEDLRYIPFPEIAQLNRLGSFYDKVPEQDVIDLLIEKEIFKMSPKKDPVQVKKKIEEALLVLKQLGLPRDQQNDRSALTLLSLLNLRPSDPWSKSNSVLIGVTGIINFIKENYQREYAPNSRESIRRQTIHQFIQAGLIIPNPDEPRPVNSPNYVYTISENTLHLLKSFNSKSWENNLKKYLANIKTLVSIYQQKREMERISIRVSEEVQLYLSAGGQNKLIEKILNEFCAYFAQKGELIYIGDAKTKWSYFDKKLLATIGIKLKDYHGKMPDLIIYMKEKKWLILIEAVTTHGPIDPKRKIELEEIFGKGRAGLVFITAFMNKKTMTKYLEKIAWETEIWVADNPTHLVHLNGKRFLGPYEKK